MRGTDLTVSTWPITQELVIAMQSHGWSRQRRREENQNNRVQFEGFRLLLEADHQNEMMISGNSRNGPPLKRTLQQSEGCTVIFMEQKAKHAGQ